MESPPRDHLRIVSRLAHDRKILVLALVAGAPALALAGVLLWQSPATGLFKGTMFGLVTLVWLITARVAQVRVTRPLQVIANILAGPRVFFAMARDGRFFRHLAEIHPRHETPANAIWALAAWAGLLSLTGGYQHLITMSQFANWIFFTMVISSVMVLRRTHPGWPRPRA